MGLLDKFKKTVSSTVAGAMNGDISIGELVGSVNKQINDLTKTIEDVGLKVPDPIKGIASTLNTIAGTSSSNEIRREERSSETYYDEDSHEISDEDEYEYEEEEDEYEEEEEEAPRRSSSRSSSPRGSGSTQAPLRKSFNSSSGSSSSSSSKKNEAHERMKRMARERVERAKKRLADAKRIMAEKKSNPATWTQYTRQYGHPTKPGKYNGYEMDVFYAQEELAKARKALADLK